MIIFTTLTLTILDLKNKLFLISIFLIHYSNFAQKNNNYVVEYDNKFYNFQLNQFEKSPKRKNEVFIYFGGIFVNEKVKVKNNQIVVLETVLKTNFSTAQCPKSEFKVNRFVCNIIEIVFDNKTIKFELDEKYFYLSINKFENEIYLNHSNSPGTTH